MPTFKVMLVIHSLVTFKSVKREYLMAPVGDDGEWGFFTSHNLDRPPSWRICNGQLHAMLSGEMFVQLDESKAGRLFMPFAAARDLGKYLEERFAARHIQVEEAENTEPNPGAN